MMTIVYPVKNGLYVNLTNRCPCRCDFCIRQNGKGAYGSDSLWLEREPTVEETLAAIRAADVSKYEELVFCGYGEPTERLDALVAVARAVKTEHPSLRIRLNTNGLADLIAGHPTAAQLQGLVDVISISLNAETAEGYVALCHPTFGLAAYPAILAYTRAVKAFVPSVMMTVVATKDFTDSQREACQRICADLGVALRIREYIPA